MRFPLRLVKRVREAWADKPLFVRISATDWAEGAEKGDDGEWKQWGIEQSKLFVGELKSLGVDLVDTSSGGNWVQQKIPLKHGYQVRIFSGGCCVLANVFHAQGSICRGIENCIPRSPCRCSRFAHGPRGNRVIPQGREIRRSSSRQRASEKPSLGFDRSTRSRSRR